MKTQEYQALVRRLANALVVICSPEPCPTDEEIELALVDAKVFARSKEANQIAGPIDDLNRGNDSYEANLHWARQTQKD